MNRVRKLIWTIWGGWRQAQGINLVSRALLTLQAANPSFLHMHVHKPFTGHSHLPLKWWTWWGGKKRKTLLFACLSCLRSTCQNFSLHFTDCWWWIQKENILKTFLSPCNQGQPFRWVVKNNKAYSDEDGDKVENAVIERRIICLLAASLSCKGWIAGKRGDWSSPLHPSPSYSACLLHVFLPVIKHWLGSRI